jgi:hypothetical protein
MMYGIIMLNFLILSCGTYSYHCAIKGQKLQLHFLKLRSAFKEVTFDIGPKLGELEESWWVLL